MNKLSKKSQKIKSYMSNSLEKQIGDILAEEIRKELDWEILTTICGSQTSFSFRDDTAQFKRISEIELWVKENTSGHISKIDLGFLVNFGEDISAAALFKTFWM